MTMIPPDVTPRPPGIIMIHLAGPMEPGTLSFSPEALSRRFWMLTTDAVITDFGVSRYVAKDNLTENLVIDGFSLSF